MIQPVVTRPPAGHSKKMANTFLQLYEDLLKSGDMESTSEESSEGEGPLPVTEWVIRSVRKSKKET